jgi:tRNA 2-thiocytidine biosynthesis protein TtcA
MQSHIDYILKKAGKAIYNYQLLEPNDKILVALSGGKDSFALLDILSKKRKSLPFNFELHAVHVRMENVPYRIDEKFYSELCGSKGIAFSILSSEVDFQEDKNHCYNCSRKRRKELFLFAQANGFNKIAFGHVLEDVLESLLMNMVYHAEISTLPPKLYMKKENLTFIRPLYFVEEKETQEYAETIGFKSAVAGCPYEVQNTRADVKQLLNKLSETHKDAKINLLNSMENIIEDYLPKSIR